MLDFRLCEGCRKRLYFSLKTLDIYILHVPLAIQLFVISLARQSKSNQVATSSWWWSSILADDGYVLMRLHVIDRFLHDMWL
jgi:hypothetical protein